ncbi:MAG: hypothetical protein A4E38_01007 [Methanoregulaceae archaeon PtaB.Bin108]|nr:MAG: hypothetical protein A4E38_01007 [Methanoregulaceae archaeon PtaB.Bin108]
MGNTLVKVDRNDLRLGWSFFRGYAPCIDLFRRMIGRVLKMPSLDTPAPDILIDTPWLVLCDGYWNIVLLCIPDLPVTGQVQLPYGGNNLETCHPEDKVEPKLIVPLPRTSVCNGGRTFQSRDFCNLFGDERAGEGGSHRVPLVGSVCPDCREDVFIHEFLPGIDGIVLVCEFFPFLGGDPDLLITLADIDCYRNYPVKIVSFLQERDADGGVEPAGICHYNGSFSHSLTPV